jgi:hypothetical protein
MPSFIYRLWPLLAVPREISIAILCATLLDLVCLQRLRYGMFTAAKYCLHNSQISRLASETSKNQYLVR